MNGLRYGTKFSEEKNCWVIYDKDKGNQVYGRFDSKFQANKRVDTLNGKDRQRKAGKTKDYGMRHPGPAPRPRAFKDD